MNFPGLTYKRKYVAELKTSSFDQYINNVVEFINRFLVITDVFVK